MPRFRNVFRYVNTNAWCGGFLPRLNVKSRVRGNLKIPLFLQEKLARIFIMRSVNKIIQGCQHLEKPGKTWNWISGLENLEKTRLFKQTWKNLKKPLFEEAISSLFVTCLLLKYKILQPCVWIFFITGFKLRFHSETTTLVLLSNRYW